uniref:unspecific monooxygenase n=1 Tax=Astatotilapia calliptera TaxID=8154 RepID=A0A3P8NEZ2_ASTCA
MGFVLFFSLQTWILLITFICIFVMYGHWTFGIFEKMGIPGPKPVMYWGTIARHNHDYECAQKYGRIWGVYEFRKPMLAVMDPDMLKTILVKECFTYFTNRRNFRLNGDLYDAVSLAEDDQWRRIRNILSPSFTSGHLKEMFSIMKHHSHKLTDSLQSKAHNDEVIIVKDFFGSYSIDVMASCIFSVDFDSIKNPSNPFITHANQMFKFSILLYIFQACFPIFLPLLECLGVSLFPKSSTAFLKSKRSIRVKTSLHIESLWSHLCTSDVSCPLLLFLTGLTEHEIISQVTMFVFAGYETSAIALVFLAYSLARNPEIMKRLQSEIDSTFPNKGPVEYEALMQMEYLDSVVSECLRLYPSIPRLERVAKETVKISEITIPKGMLVMVPVYALHRDPELWPEPEEFKPDRFSKENKQNINPYTYLPFGAGPRSCMGTRFALMMVKLAMVEVLQNFSFSVCKETEIPLEMDVAGFVSPVRPIKLKLKMRSITVNNH